jgi:hypothetical protein
MTCDSQDTDDSPDKDDHSGRPGEGQSSKKQSEGEDSYDVPVVKLPYQCRLKGGGDMTDSSGSCTVPCGICYPISGLREVLDFSLSQCIPLFSSRGL